METILITGANSLIGQNLISTLSKSEKYKIIAIDTQEIDDGLEELVHKSVVADINDTQSIKKILQDHDISTVFHLASILPLDSENDPKLTIQVNAKGTESILEVINQKVQEEKKVVKFIFPSTVAVYGLPNLNTKKKAGIVKEEEYLKPITIYGVTKLYCENLGNYYSNYYQLLRDKNQIRIDFRALRFPGIISSLNTQVNQSSNYAPEMIHSVVQGEGYESYVRPDTKISFMIMPDAIKALIQLNEVPKERIKSHIYNVQSFSVSAGELSEMINKIFPDSSISFNPDPNRQKIIDSWPESLDDSAAISDWSWQPQYNLENSFNNYLIPEVRGNINKNG